MILYDDWSICVRSPDDHSCNPLPTKNISKVVKLTQAWPKQLNLFF